MSGARSSQAALYVGCCDEARGAEPGFSRLYYGHEFCERLLPSRAELRAVCASAGERELTFTTPYVTERGLGRVRGLCEVLDEERRGAEVVFNDWGVLRLLETEFRGLRPVLGRLLHKMKRGPRLAALADAFGDQTAAYFRSCSLEVPTYQRFLRDRGVERVELDNVLQGISIDLAASGLRASLYAPYGYIATTRLCLAASCEEHGMEDEVGVFGCRKECRRFTFEIAQHGSPGTQYRKGNTIFFENAVLPEDLGTCGVDRIVTERRIPF